MMSNRIRLLAVCLTAASMLHAATGRTIMPQAKPAPAAQAREVTVTVFDARGKPAAGVPLVAGALGSIGDSLNFTEVPKSRQVTDGDGRVTLTIPPRKGRPSSNLHVQADVLAEPPLRVPLPIDPETSDKVTINLPPMGQVRVLVYGTDEHPLPGVRNVTLEVAGNKRFFDRMKVRGVPEEEGAMFRWVALGLTVSVRASVPGVGQLNVERPGPTVDRQLAVLDIRTNEDSILRVALVDAKGKPLERHSLVSILSVGDHRNIFNSKTDADGRLTLPVPDLFAGKDGAKWLLYDVRDRGASLEIPLTPDFVGFRDVEGAKLTPGDVVMRGTVVDSQRRPVAGVDVCVPLSWTGGGRFINNRARDAVHVVTTDAQGVFEVREHGMRESKVTASLGDDWFLPSRFVTYGDMAVELRALRPGRVRIVLPGVAPGIDATVLNMRRRMRGPGAFSVMLDQRMTVPLPAAE